MSYINGPAVLAPTGSTGNNTHTSVGVAPSDVHCIVINIEAVGATPTVTLAIQGSLDGTTYNTVGVVDSNSVNIATPSVNKTLTAVGAVTLFTPPGMFFKYLRLISSANTNVTYRADLYSQDS